MFICKNCGLAQLNDMTPSFVESIYDEGVCVMDEQGNQKKRKTKFLVKPSCYFDPLNILDPIDPSFHHVKE